MGIKKNILYSSFLTCSNYIFPLITYPYICRVLGVEAIGKCNYILGIVTYFLLFATMGTSVIGIREIAKNRDNPEALNKTFSSIFLLNLICTIVASFFYFMLVITVPSLSEYETLMLLGAVQLIFTIFQIEWFYKGIEEFKYITVRSIAVKFLYLICLLIFCHKPEDYVVYFLLTILSFVGNTVFNWFYKKKFVNFTRHFYSLREFFNSFFIVGVYTILASMYTSFNVVYLGWVASDIEVGYYTTAIKLFAIILSFYTAVTGVLMPRISNLNKKGEMSVMRNLNEKSLNVLIPTVLCLIIYLEVYANEIIYIIAGRGYESAVFSFRILLPILLFAGVEQILNNQILMPMEKDKYLLFSSLLGATVGMILNITLVNELQSIGSAIVWVVSVVCTTTLSSFFAYRTIGTILPFGTFLKNVVGYLPLLLLLFVIHSSIKIVAWSILLSGIFSIIYFIILQYFLKAEVVLSVIYNLKHIIKNENTNNK